MLIRRARTLLVMWHEQRLVLINYRTHISATAEPEAVRILHFFDDWARPSDLYSFMPEYSRTSLHAGIRQLQEKSFLVVKGTTDANLDADLERTWSAWLHLPAMLRAPGSMMSCWRSPMAALRSSESGAEWASGISSAIWN